MSQTFDTRALLDEINKITEAPNQKHVHSKDYHDLNSKHYEVFKKLGKAHVESFNFMIDDAFPRGIQALQPLEMELPGNDRLEIKVTDALVGMPLVHKDCNARTNLVYPSECRMRGTTYKSKLTLSFSVKVNKNVKGVFQEEVGEIPIMVMSKKCNISNLTPKQLVKRYEDAAEFGGYFILNGKERIIRFLTAQRRNYPMAVARKTWVQSGHLFTEYGVSIRCVGPDQIGSNLVLHYLSNGTAKLRFFYEKQPVFIPIVMVLKALCNYTDQYIYTELVKGKESDSFYCSCIMDMLRYLHQEQVYTHDDVKKYIGERLRIKTDLPEWYTDQQVAEFLFKKCVAIHLNNNNDKFNLLVHMTQKLFAAAHGECALENPDNPMYHELYMSGHIYFTLLLERIEMFLTAVKRQLKRTIEQKATVELTLPALKKVMSAKYGLICRPVEHLISTGNLQSKTGLGLMQTSGISVVAEKINYWRFISHFRAVHRGAYFTEMKTTACRKLYPEAWGFLCPVHTPDGTPCGLLNHMTEMCIITNKQASVRDLLKVLVNLGMEQIDKPIVSK
ncbi:DNA-directed RNA polymerase I subunit RPA2-like protein, partial [Leptotrombidium deliense]